MSFNSARGAFIDVFSHGCLFCTTLSTFMKDSKIDKKKGTLYVLWSQEQINKKEYPFSSFAIKCSRFLMLPHFPSAGEVSFAEKL